MTEEQQRIAIAKAVGFAEIERINSGAYGGLRGVDKTGDRKIVPGYLRDRNPMIEAARQLPSTLRRNFITHLCEICDREFGNGELDPSDLLDPNEMTAMMLIDTTPKHLAEAFLKALRLWQEPK